jgi:hypothetical protein
VKAQPFTALLLAAAFTAAAQPRAAWIKYFGSPSSPTNVTIHWTNTYGDLYYNLQSSPDLRHWLTVGIMHNVPGQTSWTPVVRSPPNPSFFRLQADCRCQNNLQPPPPMQESALNPSGDTKWFGVKMQYEPDSCPPGYLSAAINARFHKGVPETRKGVIFLPWLNKISAGLVHPWGTVYGIGTFRDPKLQTEFILIAADGNIYYTSAGNAPQQVTLPSGTTITTECTFRQCFDRVILLRGPDLAPLQMTDILVGFTSISQSDNGDGSLTIPNVLRGASDVNRLFLVNGDEVWVSDISDPTRYSIFDELRVNEGGEDKMVNIALFGKSTIIALKELSVYRVDGVYGDLASMSLSRVTRRYGCVAPKTAIDLGSDFIWLSHEGIASLTLTEQNEVQAAQGIQAGKYPMFSDDIKPLIQRINWAYAENSVAAFNDGKLYVAVPLDDAERLGPEYVATNFISVFSSSYIVGPLVVGRTYRFTLGNAGSITQSAVTTTHSFDFVATTTTATINGCPSDALLTSSVREVRKGVNNAVLVFDTQAGAMGSWAGHDEGNEIAVQDFFEATWLGKRRLFMVDIDGWVKLMEEDYEDALAVPYVDLEVASLPNLGVDTVRVNGGTVISAEGVSNNSGTPFDEWGATPLATARANLYVGQDGAGGFYPGSLAPWTATLAPNTQVAQIDNGVRFYSTSGVLPAIVTTGTWATVTPHTTVPITMTLTTRGYLQPDAAKNRFRWLVVDVQNWDASFNLNVVPEGVMEEFAVTRHGVSQFTYDRTKFDRPFDEPAFNEQNPDDRFAQPYRQDYALIPTGTGFAFTPGTDVRGDLHQEHREAFRVQTSARAPQITLVNSQGRLRLLSLKLKSSNEPDQPGAKL